MCETCNFIESVFESARKNAHFNYAPVLMLLKEIENQKGIHLYAGDCQIDEVSELLDKEMHYTFRHYFKCSKCERYFFIGACIRGIPIFKTLNSLENENLDNMLWGKIGVMFE